MAIVKMKKLRVIAMEQDRQEIFEKLLKLGCVEVSDPAGKLSDPAWAALLQPEKVHTADTRAGLAEAKSSLDAIKRYSSLKNGMFVKREPVSEEYFLDDANAERAREVCGRINEQLGVIRTLETERGRLQSRLSGLMPWKDMDLPLECEGTEHVLFRTGVCPAATDMALLDKAIADSGAAACAQLISEDKQQKYIFLAVLRDDLQAAMDALHPFVFSVSAFPGEKGTPAEIIAGIESRLTANDEALEAAERAIDGLGASRGDIRMYSDRLGAASSMEQGAERLLTDGTIIFFEGWCPAEKLGDLEALLSQYDCAWDAEDPSEEDIPNVPVKLKNNVLTNALNMVTEMYSLPSYANVDPNPLMAFFFILFYGIMMADMGYGLLMILAGVLITKKFAPKGTGGHLFSLITWCGISTFIMGLFTGGFFGDFIIQLAQLINPAFNPDANPVTRYMAHPLISPLNDTIMILIGCMGLGLVHIITGMAISVVIKARRKQYMSILWNEVTWWIVFAGIALMLLKVTNIVLYIGLAMIVVGAGWDAKGIGGKIIAVFVSLYNNVTGYFGDILSYSRLMALMLAGSVIAQVFNTLGTIPGNVIAFIIISMVGNALNFALNLLGCYVHDLRLQCLEFFGKFYEDGGKPFRPMEINTKFVDIQ